MSETQPTRRRVKREFVDEPKNVNQIPEEMDVVPADAAKIAAEIVPPSRSSASHAPWAKVVDDVYRIDVVETYRRLTENLSLGDAATQYGAVLAALDAAERDAFDAVRLHRAAKLEEERVEVDVSKALEIMRTSARDELEREKTDGKRSKAPTIQDVEDRMLANWPSEVTRHRERLAVQHGATRAIEELAGSWRSRCASLRAIMERVAPTR